MAEPTSIYSFRYLVTKVAKEAGIASHGLSGEEKAMPPTDIYELELCKDIVNDGIKSFVSNAPRNGWRWRRRIMSVSITGTKITGVADSASATTIVDATLANTYTSATDLVGYYCYITGGTGEGSWAVITSYDPTGTPGECTVADWLDEFGNAGGTNPATDSTFAITPVETVGGDISRYPLSENFNGEVAGQIHYVSDSAHSTWIEWVHESFIRQLRSVNVITNYPSKAAIRPLEPLTNAIDPKRRYELILDPQPSATEILEFPYELTFNKLDMETGLAEGGSDTVLLDSGRTEGDDYFNGWKVEIISGTGKGSYAVVIDYSTGTGSIDSIDDQTGDVYYVECSAAHELSSNDMITISGTTNFNGSYVVTKIDADTVSIVKTSGVATETGTWAQGQITVADWLTAAGAAGGTNPGANSVYVVEPLNNLHPAGSKYDTVIMSACLAQAQIEIEDIAAGYVDKYLKLDLPKAYEMDARSGPRKLGTMNRGRIFRERTWDDVTTDHDI